MMIRALALAIVLIFAAFIPGCSQNVAEMHDGYYTAEMSDFSVYGWKEYISIYVRDNMIVTVEYDAFNRSGFIRTWDMDYMRIMTLTDGTYPNEFRRKYETALINWQDTDMVDAISGATSSNNTFKMLAKAAIERAKAGDKQVALVEAPSGDD